LTRLFGPPLPPPLLFSPVTAVCPFYRNVEPQVSSFTALKDKPATAAFPGSPVSIFFCASSRPPPPFLSSFEWFPHLSFWLLFSPSHSSIAQVGLCLLPLLTWYATFPSFLFFYHLFFFLTPPFKKPPLASFPFCNRRYTIHDPAGLLFFFRRVSNSLSVVKEFLLLD